MLFCKPKSRQTKKIKISTSHPQREWTESPRVLVPCINTIHKTKRWKQELTKEFKKTTKQSKWFEKGGKCKELLARFKIK